MTEYSTIIRGYRFFIAAAALLLVLVSCGGDDEDRAAASPPLLSQARALADTWIAATPPERNAWSWGDGVLMVGLTRLADRTGEARYADYVRAYVEANLPTYHIAYNDHCLPVRASLWLEQRTGDRRYREPVRRFLAYLYDFAPRTSDGGVNHMGWLSGSALWMDSLFMLGPLLLDLYRESGDERHLLELRDQIRIFAVHLRDLETGLWYHRWNDATQTRSPAEPIFWARGNGWVLVTMAQFLTVAPPETPGYGEIREVFVSQAAAIASRQQADGLWTTVMNRPEESATETSNAALFAWGFTLGVRLGLLDDTYRLAAERAMSALSERIFVDDLGRWTFPGTSLGTSPGDLAHYNEVIEADNVNYGVGAFLLAAVEMDESDGDAAAVAVRERTCDGPGGLVACGREELGEGDFARAEAHFVAALAGDPLQPQASFGLGFIRAARPILDVLDELDRLYLGERSARDVDVYLKTTLRDRLDEAVYTLDPLAGSLELDFYLPRLQILENGSSIGIGAVDWDLGEGRGVLGVLRMASGALGVVDGLGIRIPVDTLIGVESLALAIAGGDVPRVAASRSAVDRAKIAAGLDDLVRGIDDLVAAIDAVMAETDDQSDDLLSQDVLRLRGEFHLPGIIPPTPAIDLLADALGLDPAWLASLTMPDDAVALLRILQAACIAARDALSR